MHKSIIEKVEEYVEQILRERTPVQNYYHNLYHTLDVVESSIEIGIGEKLSPDEMEMVQIAAWFHDIGYIEKPEGHEEVSAMYAGNFLNEENYPEERIAKVVGCILATKVPQKPKTKLERVVCDSDLNHLGRDKFSARNDYFRKEQEYHRNRKLTETEWLTSTIDFMTRHHFHSGFAINSFSKIKKKNIKDLQLQLDLILNQSK
jgi:predicted metal-dependent HD superfamily phosphohydrolase